MLKNILIGIGIIFAILCLVYFFILPDYFVDSFEKCVKGGNLVQETYPEKCVTKNGKNFTNPTQKLPSVYSLKVYFSKSLENPDDVEFVTRTTTSTKLVQFALDELVKGPSKTEKTDLKIFSSLVFEGKSNCGTDYTYTLKEKKATLKFCKTIKGSGVMSDARIISSIKQTLFQFEEIDQVIILDMNDNCFGDMSGLNKCKE